jgi:hypothetical protein
MEPAACDLFQKSPISDHILVSSFSCPALTQRDMRKRVVVSLVNSDFFEVRKLKPPHKCSSIIMAKIRTHEKKEIKLK